MAPSPPAPEPAAGAPPVRGAAGWTVPALLVVIIVSLAALVAVPYALTVRNATLRRFSVEVLRPARAATSAYGRATADEAAALGAYLATGQAPFAARFARARAAAEGALGDLDRHTRHTPMATPPNEAALVVARRAWLAAADSLLAGRLAPAAYVARLPQQEARFETTLREARRMDSLLSAETNRRTVLIQHTERVRGVVTGALGLLAVVAAGAAVALSRRLVRTSDDLAALNATLEERVARRSEEVRTLASALTLAEQSERHAIAEVLHDGLQQQLFGLQLRLYATQGKVADQPALEAEVGHAMRIAEEAIVTTRRLALDLSPPVLEGDGLYDALAWLATQMRERFGFEVTVRTEGPLTVPRADMRTLLFQTVRELLFNAVKHAGCTGARVTIRETGDAFVVEVADDGVGFPAEAASSGTGLRRARERLSLFDGALRVHSAPGAGARVEVVVPRATLGGR